MGGDGRQSGRRVQNWKELEKINVRLREDCSKESKELETMCELTRISQRKQRIRDDVLVK